MSLCVSVVSHGHGPQVRRLLERIARLAAPACAPDASELVVPQRVILTLNVPEPALAPSLRGRAWPFALEITENTVPQGFGVNHNRAFALDAKLGASAFFAVLNPDVDWQRGNPFSALRQALLADPGAGLAYPVQTDAQGRLQDFERLVPTPARLLRRYRPGGQRHEVRPNAPNAPNAPEWVNAAFLLLPRAAYAAIGGFDEGYHMYCEDVDLCLRLQRAGWRMARADDAVVVHEASRASHHDLQHLAWHLASLCRLWRRHLRAMQYP